MADKTKDAVETTMTRLTSFPHKNRVERKEMSYLIIIIAVVSFFGLQIPQHNYPALKSNQKLQ